MKVLNVLLVILLAVCLAVLVAIAKERRESARRAQAPGAQIETMRGLVEVVERSSRIAKDPTDSGVTAVLVAGQLLKHRSHADAIDYWNKALAETRNDAVARAIRGQLVDLYKQTGQTDAALEQLRTLMTSAPSTSPATSSH